ncbi:unnamed protein product [Rhodiola kirilowii]
MVGFKTPSAAYLLYVLKIKSFTTVRVGNVKFIRSKQNKPVRRT